MIFQTTPRALTRSALCGAALAFLAPGFTAQANDCANENVLKSAAVGSPVELSFRNASPESRRLYWLDPNGDRRFIAVVSPGTVLRQPTSAGHSWVVTDDAEKCLQTVTAAAEPATIDVGGTQTVQFAPPAPGVAQPIAPAVAAPVVAQPAPQMQPAPAMASPAAPMMAAAPPQSVAVQIPQVSPVAQFGLDGAQRIAADDGSVLNINASGGLQVANVRPQFSSAHWLFEPVPGTPYVRIKNGWKGTYLVDANGALRAMAAAPVSEASHWTYEPVDGTPFIQFRNRASERFLLADRNAPALAGDVAPDREPQSFWQVAPSAQAAPALAAVNPAYAAAAASCREIGGVWTGASCRAAYRERPLACRPGWVWSPEFGECEWAGGACPPWQAGPGGQCLANLTCTGGSLRASPRGLSCQCPLGMAVWGSYPRLSCVPALARILPLVVPAVGNAGRPSRPSLGAVNQIPFGGQIAAPVTQTGRTGPILPARTPATQTPPPAPTGIGTAIATTVPAAPTQTPGVTTAPGGPQNVEIGQNINVTPRTVATPGQPAPVDPQTGGNTRATQTPPPAPTGIGTAIATTVPAATPYAVVNRRINANTINRTVYDKDYNQLFRCTLATDGPGGIACPGERTPAGNTAATQTPLNNPAATPAVAKTPPPPQQAATPAQLDGGGARRRHLTPPPPPNVAPAPAATPAVATPNPPVANAPGATLPKPGALPAVAATPPTIPPTGAAGAPAPTGAAGTPTLFGARGATAPTGAAGAGAAIGAAGAPAAPKPAAVATAPAGAKAGAPAIAPPAPRPLRGQERPRLQNQQAIVNPQGQPQRAAPQTAKPRPAPPPQIARPAQAPQAMNPGKPSKCPQGQARC